MHDSISCPLVHDGAEKAAAPPSSPQASSAPSPMVSSAPTTPETPRPRGWPSPKPVITTSATSKYDYLHDHVSFRSNYYSTVV